MKNLLSHQFENLIKSHNCQVKKVIYPRLMGTTTQEFIMKPGHQKTCVLIHATGNDRYYGQLHFVEHLLNVGFNILIFDLDGHGVENTSLLDVPSIFDALQVALQHCSDIDDEIHIIGQSLGAYLGFHYLLASQPKIASAVLIGLPDSLRMDPRILMYEGLSFLKSGFWHHKDLYGVWGLVPSFGCVKRRWYPVRLAQRSKHYLEVVKEIFEQPLVDAYTDVPCQFIFGQYDRIAMKEGMSRYIPHCQRYEVTTLARETHLTLFFSEYTMKKAVEWMISNQG